MNIFEAIIIAIVEGLTEFLPVSSTGHMIIAEKIMGVEDNDFTKLFTVGIQLGAILAVVVLYWKKFTSLFTSGANGIQFYLKLLVAVLPALVLGFIFSAFFSSDKFFPFAKDRSRSGNFTNDLTPQDRGTRLFTCAGTTRNRAV